MTNPTDVPIPRYDATLELSRTGAFVRYVDHAERIARAEAERDAAIGLIEKRNNTIREIAQINRDFAGKIVQFRQQIETMRADAHNLKSPVHAICNQNITETLAAALEQSQRAERAEAELDAAIAAQTKEVMLHAVTQFERNTAMDMSVSMANQRDTVLADMDKLVIENAQLRQQIEGLSRPVSDEEWSDCAHLVSMDEGRHYDSMIDRECLDSIIAARAGGKDNG